MAVDIKVPSVGESVTEGTLSRWLKKDGETVRQDEPVFELETEKATSDIPAPASGVLHIAVQAGQSVSIGAVVGRIEESAAAPTAPAKEKPAPAARPEAAPKKPAAKEPAPRAPVPKPAEREVILSPAARRLAEEKGLDVSSLKGTGRGGRVTKEDVVNQQETRPEEHGDGRAAAVEPKPEEPALSSPAPTPPPAAPSGRESRQRMSSIRQRIAERLLVSQQSTATLTTFNEADMAAVMALRNQYKDRFKEKHGVSLGFMSFFVKACVEALRAYPIVKARIDGGDIVHPDYFDMGVAVSTDRGLMVPVIRDPDRLSFAEIEKQIAALAQKARDGKITVNDLQGGVFTITNGGIFGSLLSTPILNPPQSAILGMHAIQKRPVAVEDQVVVRPMMYLALSYDHRLIDGRDAVRFLVRVKECIENPERLLLEV
jgi:2-oxoglutarate dehydrogenase E2 component (dihydrolipoamide succinyltransferase)